MKGIELSSIDQAVRIVEIFSQPVWLENERDPEGLVAELQSIKKWVELTSGLKYSELVKTVH